MLACAQLLSAIQVVDEFVERFLLTPEQLQLKSWAGAEMCSARKQRQMIRIVHTAVDLNGPL